jgi:hypothetical protein
MRDNGTLKEFGNKLLTKLFERKKGGERSEGWMLYHHNKVTVAEDDSINRAQQRGTELGPDIGSGAVLGRQILQHGRDKRSLTLRLLALICCGQRNF